MTTDTDTQTQTHTRTAPQAPALIPPIDPTIDARKATVAAQAGVEVSRVSVVQMELSHLLQNGFLIDIDVHGTGMFSASLNWADLGIIQDDVRRKLFTKGTKILIPEGYIRAIRSLDTRLRQVTNKYTYDIQGFRPYQWLPWTAFDKWKSEWDRLCGKLDDVRSEIIERHDQFPGLIAADFTEAAQRIWPALLQYGAVNFGGHTFIDQDVFTDYLVRTAVSKLPSVKRIEEGLYADYRIAMLASRSEVEAERLATDRVRQQRDLEREQHRARQQQIWDRERLERERVQSDIHAEEMKRRARELKMDAIYKAETEHARQQFEKQLSPVAEVINELRRQILEDVNGILASLQANGHMRGQTAKKAAGLLAFFDLMAAHSDPELRDALVELKETIGPVGSRKGKKPERDTEAIVQRVNKIREITSKLATDSTRLGRGAFLEV